MSVSPLTWSHATYVATCLRYVSKLEELKAKSESQTNAKQS